MKKKPRLSILTRIALLFMAALIISSILTAALGYKYMMNDAARQGEELANVVVTAAGVALGSKEDGRRLFDDEDYREEIHRTFRHICSRTGSRYLYLYYLDEYEARHYVITAAKDDEDDRKLNEEYGFGAIQATPLHTVERNVLNGNTDGDFEFINNELGYVCMYIVPIMDGDEVIALIGVDYPIESILEIAKGHVKMLLLLGIMLLSVAFVISLFLIRHSVIRPIAHLSGRMKSFASDRMYSSENNISSARFEDEMTDIEKSFEDMAGDISKYVADIEQLAQEKIQTKTQLEIARNIQCGIIPFEYSASGSGYEAYGREMPAKEVGGDFYDIFTLDEENICVVMGDVSGKGVSAAMFMIMIKTAIKAGLKAGNSLLETFSSVNREIFHSNPEFMFATVCALLLNTKTGAVRYINAGHNLPLLLSDDPSFVKVKSGMVMGIFEDVSLEEETLQLHDGEGLLIYTDGITEAINSEKVQYGRERLEETARNCYKENNLSYAADTLINRIVDSVNEFAGDLEQFDDITCAAIFYRQEDVTDTSSASL